MSHKRLLSAHTTVVRSPLFYAGILTGLTDLPAVTEVWVCGGSRKKQVHVYSPDTNTWRQEADLPTEQSWGACWSCEGRLMVVGGAHMDARASGTPVFDDRVFGLRSEAPS